MISTSIIHCQKYKIIQINYIAGIFGRLYLITMLRLAALTGSRNEKRCAIHCSRHAAVEFLTPPITHAQFAS